MLIWLRDQRRQVFPLSPDDRPTMIGSSAQCSIVIDEASVAPEHARIRVSNVGIEIDDLGSPRGTQVNGFVIDKHFLSPNDELKLGNVTFKVEISTDTTARPVCRRCGVAIDPQKTRRLTRERLESDKKHGGELCEGCERRRSERVSPFPKGFDATPLPPGSTPSPPSPPSTPIPGLAPSRARPISGVTFTLAGYETLGVAGEGSQGIVYKMRHPVHGIVAVKRLGPEHGQRAKARFKREAMILRLLKHPNLVALVDAVEVNQATVIVMEFVEGQSLHQLMSRGPLPAGRVLRLARQIAEGLACAARSGVVHRDIKPTNILVAPGDVAKLTDFGLARVEEDQAKLTLEGQWLGTPHYMAPEQIDGKTAEARSDVYALGATCFQALTGILPFTGKTAGELFKKVLSEPPPLQVVEHRGGPALKILFERVLAKRPEDRPDAEALVELIDETQTKLR